MENIGYHKIIITMTNGEEFETRSTYGKEGDKIKLDRDPHTHPAWTGNLTSGSTNSDSNLAKFNNKYKDLFS